MRAIDKADMLVWDQAGVEDIARAECELHERRESVTAEAIAAILQKPSGEVREIMASSVYMDALERVQHERETGLDALAGMSATALRSMILQVQASLDRGEVDPSEIPALSRPLVSILAEFNKLKAKADPYADLPMINVIFDGGIHSESSEPLPVEVVDVDMPALEAVSPADDAEPAHDTQSVDDGIDMFELIDFDAEVSQ